MGPSPHPAWKGTGPRRRGRPTSGLCPCPDRRGQGHRVLSNTLFGTLQPARAQAWTRKQGCPRLFLHRYIGVTTLPPQVLLTAAPPSIPVLPTDSPEVRGQLWTQGPCSVGTPAGPPPAPALPPQTARDDAVVSASLAAKPSGPSAGSQGRCLPVTPDLRPAPGRRRCSNVPVSRTDEFAGQKGNLTPTEGPCCPRSQRAGPGGTHSVPPAGVGLGHRSRLPPRVCPFCSESSFVGGGGLFKGGEQAPAVSETSAWPADAGRV